MPKTKIRQYSPNSYRAIINMGGGDTVKYSPTREEAQEWYEMLYKARQNIRDPGMRNIIKRSCARHQELPVGIHESFDKKVLSDGSIREYPTMIATLHFDGKYLKSFHAAFGMIRTREEAIALLEQKRGDYVADNPELFEGKGNPW